MNYAGDYGASIELAAEEGTLLGEVIVKPKADHVVNVIQWLLEKWPFNNIPTVPERNAQPSGAKEGYWDIDINGGMEDAYLDYFKKIYDAYEDKTQFFKDNPNYDYLIEQAREIDRFYEAYGFIPSQVINSLLEHKKAKD